MAHGTYGLAQHALGASKAPSGSTSGPRRVLRLDGPYETRKHQLLYAHSCLQMFGGKKEAAPAAAK